MLVQSILSFCKGTISFVWSIYFTLYLYVHSKQCEKHYPNGTKEIRFPNDTVKYIYSNGEEESVFPDGLSQRNYPNGDVTLHMPTGIKEFYTADYKVWINLLWQQLVTTL